MTQTLVAKISNVGPIDELEVPLAPGRLTRVTGANGAGKSTAINAVLAACGSDVGSDLTPRDGHSSGSVEMPGVTLRIGKRLSRKGEAETFVVMEDGGDLQKFIDPGVKDPAAADARRIEAILNMAGVKVDDDSVKALVGDELFADFCEEFTPTRMKAVELVATLKRWLQKKARTIETNVARAEGELSAIPPAIAPEDCVKMDVKPFVSDMTARKTAVDKAESAAVEAQKASEAIAGMINPGDLEAREMAVARIEAEYCALETELAMKNTQLMLVRQEHTRCLDALDTARKTQKALIDLQATIATGVTPERIAELTAEFNQSTELYDRAVAHNQKADAELQNGKRRAIIESRIKTEQRMAETVRVTAAKLPALLREAMTVLEGWSVNDEMRLCCQHKRGVIEFSELSPGEQAVRAIQVATCVRKTTPGLNAVVGLPQHIWESLDEANQKIVQKFATERQLAVVVAESSHGDTPTELEAGFFNV